MTTKAKTASINYAAGGTTVKGAILLLDSEFDLVYGHLNTLFKCQYGSSTPTDNSTGDLWVDSSSASSPQLKYYNGSSFVSLTARVVTASSAPATAVSGDFWFDTTTNTLKRYTGSAWAMISFYAAASAPTTITTNSLWYDTTEKLLKYYNGSAWVICGIHGAAGNFLAHASAGSITFTHATDVTCLFDTDSSTGWDNRSWYDTGTGKYTPQVAGYYEIVAGATVVNPVTGPASINGCLSVSIFKNTAAVSQRSVPQCPNPLVTSIECSAIIYCNGSTDYVLTKVYQANSDTSDVTNSGATTGGTFMRGKFLGSW